MNIFKHTILLTAISAGSILAGQSFFNPVFGTDADLGSARAAAMGSTNMAGNNTSSLLLFNPAGLNWQTNWFSVDYQFHGNTILERRGYDLKDSFGDYLTTSDYVANRQQNGYQQLGVTYNMALDEMNIAAAVALSPLTSFNYSYEEEVRGAQKFDDGVIGIRDPLLGYHVLDVESTLNMLSFGGSFGMTAFDHGRFSAGIGLHRILDSKGTQTVYVDTVSYDENYLADVVTADYEFDTPGDFFLSLGTNFTIVKGLTGSLAYESKARVTSDDAAPVVFNTENGYPEYMEETPDMQVNFMLHGIDYVKPSRLRAGLTYIPRQMVPMMLAVEVEKINMSEKFDTYKLEDVIQWKFGMEYMAFTDTPIRAGLIFRESPLKGLSPESIFTFGTGKGFGRLSVDVAGQFTVFGTYDAVDLFPVAGDTRPDYDRVNESRFDFTGSLNYRF